MATTASPSVSLQPLGAARNSNARALLSSRVGTHKDYRIHRSMPLSEPLRGLPPMARPVDASYYPTKSRTPAAAPAMPAPSSSSSLYYRQRSESFEAMLLGPGSHMSFGSGERRSRSTGTLAAAREPETPFDAHLQSVYDGTCDPAAGLAFFESHGYYDVDAVVNTVEMFRQNFGLTDVFWDKALAPGLDSATDDDHVLLVVDDPSAPLGVASVGTTLYRRHRTVSGRFELIDDDAASAAYEQQQREARLRAKVLELDEFDLRELAHEQAALVHAISAIRSETMQFQQYFSQVFRDEDAQVFQYAPSPPPSLQYARRTTLSATASNTMLAAAVPPPPTSSVQLPPYCGNVFVLKDTIPYLLRSWHKRWCYLDFASGLVLFYKRSYWKSPRGVLDLRDVTKVERMNASDFRLEFRSANQPMLLLRTKLTDEAALWVNLLRFAKHHIGTSPSPLQMASSDSAAPAASVDMRSSSRLFASKQSKVLSKHKSSGGKAPKNQVEMLAMLLSNSAAPAPASSPANAMSSASSTCTASTSGRRNSVSTA